MHKKYWLVIAVIGCFALLQSAVYPGTKDIRTAIDKSLPLLARSSHFFLEAANGCHSCHGQGLGSITLGMAKEKGFTINQDALQEAIDSIVSDAYSRKGMLSECVDPPGILISGGYDLWGLSVNHYPSAKELELLIHDVMRRQTQKGNWITNGARPPLEYYSFSCTAMAVRAMQSYAAALWPEEVALRTQRARNWLMRTPPRANEEKVFQLLGLTWSGADRAFIGRQAEKLLAEQHADGGWGQLDSLVSDSYATGQCLFALNQSGQLKTDQPAYQKGIAFLLRTQFEDGSWEVKSRTIPAVPYVPSGFPHGDNQFISAAGSSWATMALILAAD